MILIVALLIFAISTGLNWAFLYAQSFLLLTMYGNSVISNARTLSLYAGDFESYASDVMETYRSLPEDLRKDPTSEAYRSHFSRFLETDFYKTFVEFSKSGTESTVLKTFFLAAYDEPTGALVCLLDPDALDQETKDLYPVGGWEPLGLSESKDLFSDGGDGTPNLTIHTEGEEQSIRLAKPVTNRENTVIGYAVINISMDLVDTSSFIFFFSYFVILTIILILIVLISRHRLKRRITIPISRIFTAAETYSERKREGRADEAPVFNALDIHTGDELEELSIVMADMEKDIGLYERDLAAAAAEEERIHTELNVATRIQSSMLPDPSTAFPGRQDFTICASMDPAKEVGGDFYDFFLIDEDHLGLVIADVSGKGIPASLFMMSSMIIISNFASIGLSPAEVLRRSNEKLCANNRAEMFVTVWFGILNLTNGLLTTANAGHEYPAVRLAGEECTLLHDKHGFVLGGMEDVTYRECTISLTPGSTVFVYTDGLTEATNSSNELYGTDRLIGCLNRLGDREPEALLKGVTEDVNLFVKDAPQFDDLTMLCIRYNGRDQKAALEAQGPAGTHA